MVELGHEERPLTAAPAMLDNIRSLIGKLSLYCVELQWNLSIMATFGDRHFGHYREVAFIEGLFYTQTVYLGPGCSAIIERLAFHSFFVSRSVQS